jgi:hypothetical protein
MLKVMMMGEQLQESDGFQPGDKIRVRVGAHTGARGIIQSELNGLLEILLDESNIINVPVKDVTNYSLAARRAWQVMPKRSGRPQLPAPRKKMVSIRLDIDVWDRLGEAVEAGLIPSREKAINVWLHQQLDSLFNGESSPNTPQE